MSNEWEFPKKYKISSASEIEALVYDEKISSKIDPIDYISDELFELKYPGHSEDIELRKKFDDQIKEQGLSYGEWFHYPWNNSLVRFPENDDYYDLRTSRNRNLITKGEQNILRNKKIAAFGLSVGSNVIDSTIHTGIGNEYMLFDFDRLGITNLNRIQAGMGSVGLRKTTVLGRKIAELDPYINQQHFSNGYDETTDAILRKERPDVIIDEVDNIDVKVRLRDIANELKIPVIMAGDSGDKIVLDIERYDLKNTKYFNGKVPEKSIIDLRNGSISKKDQESALLKLFGLKNLSPRLIDSSMRRGVELGGFPQLGTTASIGGAMTATAIRDIFLDREINSGTRVEDVRKTIKSGNPTSFSENVKILKDFVKYRKSGK